MVNSYSNAGLIPMSSRERVKIGDSSRMLFPWGRFMVKYQVVCSPTMAAATHPGGSIDFSKLSGTVRSPFCSFVSDRRSALFRTPESYEEQRLQEFDVASKNSSSAIRGYRLPDLGAPGWIYFAVVANGNDRRFGKVYLRALMTYTELAVEFGRQGNYSAMTRSVYEHERFSWNVQHRGLESHFRMNLVFGGGWQPGVVSLDNASKSHRYSLGPSSARASTVLGSGEKSDFLTPYGEIVWKNLMEEWVYAGSQ
ncbi:hypothetical protein B0H10DRAFT_1955152 [Mycena sp. CBHHK59/15]|nr:hypothetical protein B0H10DRAFT_1955152 [Mycena sp. CBHHK59/15]